MCHGNELENKTLSGFPAGRLGVTTAGAGARRLFVGRYPGWQSDLRRLPRHLFQGAQWLIDESGAVRSFDGAVCLTVAGAAQVDRCPMGSGFLLPVELRRLNSGTSTNAADSKAADT